MQTTVPKDSNITLTKRDLAEVRRLCEGEGYGNGYTRELEIRVSDSGVETLNTAYLEEDLKEEHDLVDFVPIRYLPGSIIPVGPSRKIELYITVRWRYETVNYVFPRGLVVDLGQGPEILWGDISNADILRAAVRRQAV